MPDETATNLDIDQIIGDYIQATEAGQVPSRRELLEKHPEHASALEVFFADFDRLDNRAGAFKLPTTKPPAQRPKVRYFGDFELLEEIADGGMGLVYKARQESLNRIVALKLIRAGTLAKPIDLARFRIEAEAAAQLDHPNIVPLYEVGDHEGQHYLAMKYIDGPPLSRLQRADIRTEVAAIEAVARAVHYAHQQGILHRDIKPSNILVQVGCQTQISRINADLKTKDNLRKSAQSAFQNSSYHPFITDFGLAKRLDANLSLTETGQGVGTAGYWSPEQALGKKGLTVTTDVFSLGAVLYERLTGQMAFPGATHLERLRSLDRPTPSPTMVVPTLPRDLETVCLKCLEREPTKRYQSAGDLADDLGRWLNGEPIVARPVGKMEKFWLWCRRNPAVAGWASTAIIGIACGAIATTVLFIKANSDSTAAAESRERADKYLDQAKGSLSNYLHTVIQTLGVRINDQRTPTERWAIFEIAQKDDEFKMKLLSEVFSSPEFAEKFARSSEHAVQALIGGSETRRIAALQIAKTKLQDMDSNEQIRYAAMVLALQLGADDVEIPDLMGNTWCSLSSDCPWVVSVEQLSCSQIRLLTPHWQKILERTENPRVIRWIRDGLVARYELGGYVDEIAKPAADRLLAIVDRAMDFDSKRAAIGSLIALAPRLGPHSALGAIEAVAKWEAAQRSDDARVDFGAALAVFAAKLDQDTAIREFHSLLAKMEMKEGLEDSEPFRLGLKALVTRMDRQRAVLAFHDMTTKLAKSTDPNYVRAAGQGLTALATRLDNPNAIHAFDQLIAIMHRMTDSHFKCVAIGQGLAALAPNLDQPASRRASAELVKELATVNKSNKASDYHVLLAARQGLVALAEKLDGHFAIEVSDSLIGSNLVGVPALEETAKGLGILAEHLDQAAALRAFRYLVSSLFSEHFTIRYVPVVVRHAMMKVAAQLEPPAAARASKTLIDHLRWSRDGRAYYEIGACLSILAPRLDGPVAVDVYEAVSLEFDRESSDAFFTVIGAGLHTLATKIDDNNALRVLERLLTVLNESKMLAARSAAIQGLTGLCARMDKTFRKRAFRGIAAVLEGTSSELELKTVGLGFAKLASQLDGDMQLLVCQQLIAAIERSDVLYQMDDLQTAALTISDSLPDHQRRLLRQQLGKAAAGNLIRVRNKDRFGDTGANLQFLFDQMGEMIEASIASGDLKLSQITELSYQNRFTGFRFSVFSSISSIKEIADCLRHPSCVGEVRQQVLRRLEQLAFPPDESAKRQAVAESVVTGLTQPLANGVFAAARETQARKERKFRTIWDAVAWLKVHHPEIDLDAPYRPRR